VYRFKCYEDLKHKLGEIKTKCEGLESNISNGIGQIQELCNDMRNEVNLRAEILIEQVHQITESLIAEIDEYEKECVDSFNSKIDEYSEEFAKLLSNTNDFCNSTSKYMNEFKVDKNMVKESLANANELICKLNQETYLFEKMKFNERIIQFTNSSFEFVRELIGSLCNKRLMFEEFKFDKYKYNKSFEILEHDDFGQKAVFYIDDEENLNIDLLDSNGKLVKHVPNLMKTREFLVKRFSENYIVYVSASIFGQTFIRQEADTQVIVMIDKEFNYLKHKVIDTQLWCIGNNDSNLFCFDHNGKYYYYDISLELHANKKFNKISEKVGIDFYDIFMNDSHLFILCIIDDVPQKDILRIFDLKTCELVKEIEIEGDEMELVSTGYLILFDSKNKILYLYDQSEDFEKLDQVDLTSSLDGDEISLVYADKSMNVLFQDRSRAKFVSFDQIFSIPMILS
jgi:hypothetical protein